MAPPSRPAGVREVREVALELLVVFLGDRHVPGAILGALTGRRDLIGELVVVAHDGRVDAPPSAMTQAPVSVAMSSSDRGLKRRA